MNCKKTQDHLSSYLDQVLSREEMILVEKHLEKCALCRRELNDLKETIYLIHTLPESPLPTGFGAEFHHKLVALEKEKELKESGWRSSLSNLFRVRKQWVSLGMAAVLMLFLFTALASSLLGQTPQSDLSLNSVAQNAKKADFSLNDNLEMGENQLPDFAMDNQEKPLENKEESLPQKERQDSDHNVMNAPVENIQNTDIAPAVVVDENREVESKEPIRQNSVEVARSNNGEEEKKNLFRMAAIPSVQSINSVQGKNILPDQDFQFMIKRVDYTEVFDQISNLREELTDVLDVVYQNIDGETGNFIITVTQGFAPKLWTRLNDMNSSVSSVNSVNQEIYNSDASNGQGDIISLRVIIKEKKD